MANSFDGITNFSSLSLTGDGTGSSGGTLWARDVVVRGTLAGASTLSSTNTLRVGGQAWFGSGISVGTSTNTGTLIPAISSTSSLVAAFVVQGSASSFTIVLWAAAQPYDQILTTPVAGAGLSSLSSGLIAHSHCTQAGQIEFRLSNASTLVQNQSTRTWYFTRIAPF